MQKGKGYTPEPKKKRAIRESHEKRLIRLSKATHSKSTFPHRGRLMVCHAAQFKC
jgi:hypothetical protein